MKRWSKIRDRWAWFRIYLCFKVSIHMFRVWWSYFSMWTHPVPPFTSSFILHIHTWFYMIIWNLETINERADTIFVLLRWGKFIPYAYLQVYSLCFTVSLTYGWKVLHCVCKPHCLCPGHSGRLWMYVNVLSQWFMNNQASKPWLKCQRFGLSNISKYVSFISKPSFAEYLLFIYGK